MRAPRSTGRLRCPSARKARARASASPTSSPPSGCCAASTSPPNGWRTTSCCISARWTTKPRCSSTACSPAGIPAATPRLHWTSRRCCAPGRTSLSCTRGTTSAAASSRRASSRRRWRPRAATTPAPPASGRPSGWNSCRSSVSPTGRLRPTRATASWTLPPSSTGTRTAARCASGRLWAASPPERRCFGSAARRRAARWRCSPCGCGA